MREARPSSVEALEKVLSPVSLLYVSYKGCPKITHFREYTEEIGKWLRSFKLLVSNNDS